MPIAECRVPNCRDAAVLALRSHCHLLAIGKAVRMMRMIPMMPMALITLMMLMMLTMLVMLAMAPMLALGHGCCPHAGMAADGGGEPGEVDELPAACELEPELLLLLLLLTLLGLTLSCAAS